jgi:hypothetical protein
MVRLDGIQTEGYVMKLAIGLAFLLLPALSPTVALSQSLSATEPTSIVDALQDAGYRATLTTDSGGDPKIKSSTDGTNFSIYFYGCRDNQNCRDLQFVVAFDTTDSRSASLMNAWNSEKVAGTAYIDDEGDPYLTMTAIGARELPQATFDNILSRWDSVVGDFKDHIDWD